MGQTNQQLPSLLPTPIAEMGPWDFWARADAVGLPDDDAAAIRAGTANPEQVERAQAHSRAAMNALVSAQGPQVRKPS
jgi:hypothetical protein